MKNNFKELEELELENVEFRSSLVNNRVQSEIGVFRFFTDIIDLYIPKILDVFLSFAGSEDKGKSENSSKYPDMN